MDKDPLCKGCGHAISAHNMRRPEKRARMAGTMVSDFPSGREEPFNIHSGRSDDACSEADCSCLAFVRLLSNRLKLNSTASERGRAVHSVAGVLVGALVKQVLLARSSPWL